jgi:hypothetical protein
MSVTGITKTIIWTQFSEAVKKDFSIDLPKVAGDELHSLISEIAFFSENAMKENATLIAENTKLKNGTVITEISNELGEVRAERDKAKTDLHFYAGKVDQLIAERDDLNAQALKLSRLATDYEIERDALKAKLEEGIRVFANARKYGYDCHRRIVLKANATLILDDTAAID